MNQPLHIAWLPEQEQTLPIKRRSEVEPTDVFGAARLSKPQSVQDLAKFLDLAEWNSTTQQIGNLRYHIHNFCPLRIRQAAVSRNDSPHNKGWGRNGSWPDFSGGFEIRWFHNPKSNPFDLNQL